MLRTMMKSKIHRATVTHADLHYVGSVTVDQDLMDAADLLEGEQVTIVDIDNGARLETYVIAGERGSGVIGINGAAAHLVNPGDLVILIAYGVMDEQEMSRVRAARGVRRCRQQAGRTRFGSGARARGLRTDHPADALQSGVSDRSCSSPSTSGTPTSFSGCSPGSGSHSKLVQDWRMRTDPRMTADELALKIRGLLGAEREQVTGGLRAVDGAVGAARDPRDARPVLGSRAARRGRTRCPDRCPAAGRQSQGSGRRPDRQQSGGAPPLRQRVHRRRLRHVDVCRRRLREG